MLDLCLTVSLCLSARLCLSTAKNKQRTMFTYSILLSQGYPPATKRQVSFLRQDAGYGPFGYISNTYGHVMRFHSEFHIGFHDTYYVCLSVTGCPEKGRLLFSLYVYSLCLCLLWVGGGSNFCQAGWRGFWVGTEIS